MKEKTKKNEREERNKTQRNKGVKVGQENCLLSNKTLSIKFLL